MLVPTAPLTNLALMLERHPDVAERLEHIVWMGGAIAEGNVTPAAEFNAFVDPEAAAVVFASGIPITMVGLDVTHKALFTRAHAERLRGTGRAGRFVAELSDFFQAFHERSYGFDGSPIHDAMAVAHVIDPTLLTTRHTNVAVETHSEFCDGRTVVDLRGVTGREPNADVGSRRRRRAVPRAARIPDSVAAVSLVFACIAPHGDLDLDPAAASGDGGARPPVRCGRRGVGDRRDPAQRPRRAPFRRGHGRRSVGEWETDRETAAALLRIAAADPRRLVRRQPR